MQGNASAEMLYDRKAHAASQTDSYLFSQLIPYIGNKRKLLGLIARAVASTGEKNGIFLDAFAGSGVVSRWAKQAGFSVLANDWEPYAEAINRCFIGLNVPPSFGDISYEQQIRVLNDLPDHEGWVTRHLCPDCDDNPDPLRDRLFFTRANGMRIDAIRDWIDGQDKAGNLTSDQKAALMGPLLYQACYTSNTSGVFKGFHNGWGGKTGTALYRIKSRLALQPAVLMDLGQDHKITRLDAQALAESMAEGGEEAAIAYLDPPYNQHPYGANYHVLNTITLNDAPALTPKIEGRNKAAIRLDWREDRRSAYNYRDAALQAYESLLQKMPARWLLTSYSTDGTIPLQAMIEANLRVGATDVVLQGYKRYRVSTQRFSRKPMNIEFILISRKGERGGLGKEALLAKIEEAEQRVLAAHPENMVQETYSASRIK